MSLSNRLVISNPVHAFGVTWFGQLISLMGSGLTSFAIGVQVYQTSGSVTQFSLFTFLVSMPMVLLSPVAGALIDRWDRRKAMLFSDLGAGFSSILIWLLLVGTRTGHWKLQAWHLIVPITLGALCSAFRWPAYVASTTLLVPKKHLGRANGMIELAQGAGQILTPALAGILVVHVGSEGVVLVDLATFVFSIVSLLLVRFPKPPSTAIGRASKGTLWREIVHGLNFIRTRRGLVGLMIFIAVVNLTAGVVTILITPLVLSFANVTTLGNVLSISGLGMLAGGLMMSAWGGPRRRIYGVLGFNTLTGLALLLAAPPPSAPLIVMGTSLFLFSIPPISTCCQAIWQSKVAPDLQGRVFSARRMLSAFSAPVGSLLAGPLADRFFEPWMAPGGALAGTVGRVMGTGPGRGIGLLFVVMSLVTWLNLLVAWLSPRVRNVEEELPDFVLDPTPEKGPGSPGLSAATLNDHRTLAPDSGS